MEKLVILHTNDLHSHFENWPKIRRFMLGTRAAEQAQGASVLAFDDGDAMDRSVPLTEATDGQINIQLLNEIGYDAVTIGNNEGVGNPHAVLEHLYDHANFPVALANLFEPDGTRPRWAKPVVMKQTPAGTRVAIVGFTAPFFSRMNRMAGRLRRWRMFSRQYLSSWRVRMTFWLFCRI